MPVDEVGRRLPLAAGSGHRGQLTDRATKAGVDVRLDVFPGMLHTFQMADGRAPEADDAIRRMADWVRPKLGL